MCKVGKVLRLIQQAGHSMYMCTVAPKHTFGISACRNDAAV